MTKTMTLTEFLLARIAEDETWAGAVTRQIVIAAAPPMEPARVLAECEAKRRIVESAALYVDDGDPHPEDPITFARSILTNLAAVYADHPDYDEGWRV